MLSNFSSFSVQWEGKLFPTNEHAYHWEEFRQPVEDQSDDDAIERHRLAQTVHNAPSAHEAFTVAETGQKLRRPDWDTVKVDVMRNILRAKVSQNKHVAQRLLATGQRELVENSWQDGFWGWGPKRGGANMLDKLWMEIRDELRTKPGT